MCALLGKGHGSRGSWLGAEQDPRRKIPEGRQQGSGHRPLAVPRCHPIRGVTATAGEPCPGRTGPGGTAGPPRARQRKLAIKTGGGQQQGSGGSLWEGREPRGGPGCSLPTAPGVLPSLLGWPPEAREQRGSTRQAARSDCGSGGPKAGQIQYTVSYKINLLPPFGRKKEWLAEHASFWPYKIRHQSLKTKTPIVFDRKGIPEC